MHNNPRNLPRKYRQGTSHRHRLKSLRWHKRHQHKTIERFRRQTAHKPNRKHKRGSSHKHNEQCNLAHMHRVTSHRHNNQCSL